MAESLKKYCLALDLKDDSEKIQAYVKHHQQVWPEINQSIKDSGIQKAEIFSAVHCFLIPLSLSIANLQRQRSLKSLVTREIFAILYQLVAQSTCSYSSIPIEI